MKYIVGTFIVLAVIVVLAMLAIFVWASVTGDAETADRSLTFLDRFIGLFDRVSK